LDSDKALEAMKSSPISTGNMTSAGEQAGRTELQDREYPIFISGNWKMKSLSDIRPN
jgi:hypothetical protein